MRIIAKTFVAVLISITLLSSPSMAQGGDNATTTTTSATDNDHDDSGKWGLAGLLGLLGLLGLKRKDDNTARRTTTATPNR